ncbi:hypothetical protein K435DRAFT_714295 [Dendrothele bispora CBS 962.96]|uniref:DUF3533 domain-containing protein n=1 Tax=Dendrothele bispora (strain CBS 962.96) TaxID=1314807 RepID=A0A4S8MQ85_DENBC|nr:hypothetical protein K435DRAFT_714295 [Dendrothele bispora CBS 962.96]
MVTARKIYFKVLFGGSLALVVVMFAVFSIYWGALWKTPAHNLHGWVVDFDQSNIGTAVVQTLVASSTSTKITWTEIPASEFAGGPSEIAGRIAEEGAWVAVVVHANATSRLGAAAASADSSYNGTSAITVYASEARSENAFRSLIRPTVQGLLGAVAENFANQFAKQLSSSSNLSTLLSNAPQIVTQPISYTIDNLHPFDVPVATAITFVGLIYLLILSFFIVNVSLSARQTSGLEQHLTTGSLIRLRLASSFVAYFFIALFYSLLSKAFQVDFSRKFGPGGFVLFWMLNWIGMLAVGLALESMITLLTIKGVPFFMILWIIANVSVCFLPIDVLPRIFHYGYAMPFYNVSRAIRTILFSTKNTVGLNFGILLAWVAVSVMTLILFQWFMRRKHITELDHAFEVDKEVADD